jgi:hypothetical protein
MAGRYNMIANQGATFQLIFTIKTNDVPWTLSTYTARMKVKTFPSAETSLIELTNANGRIIFNNSNNQVTLLISATDTAALPPGRFDYDLEFEDNVGVVTRILEGKFVSRQEVTD